MFQLTFDETSPEVRTLLHPKYQRVPQALRLAVTPTDEPSSKHPHWTHRMTLDQLLQQYEQGPELLRAAVAKAQESQYGLHPVPGKWSIRQVVCHIADFEPVYADRMKRVLVEDNPTMFGGDPDVFASGLHYEIRDVREELDLIALVRKQMARILRQTDVEDFQRTGVHSESGPLTLETLLERITNHIPHHVKFINDKTAAMH